GTSELELLSWTVWGAPRAIHPPAAAARQNDVVLPIGVDAGWIRWIRWIKFPLVAENIGFFLGWQK
ncbi:MAG TPA: hypothetical protein VKP69_26235, partial [Isosphaeraceae bacterium]|nr:hypothetical protein [Isosphaeraceae bacterium]